MLVDEATISVEAGKGGDGVVSFRREKFIDKGGPDGGDGGKGGNIILESSTDINTLNDYARLKIFKADNGLNGSKAKKYGAKGEDLVLKVPVGTMVYNKNDNELIHDFQNTNDRVVIAKGGKGGLGNVHFKSATNRVPREFEPGEIGEKKELLLTLRMVADVGLIGKPSVGKSTLISVISNAKPKIADYPFTTLEPNLGVVRHKGKNFIVCDIPGLIEGASKGKGLGIKFLKHISRTRILVHIIDATSENYAKDYDAIRNELKSFDKKLAEKTEIIVINKIDLQKPSSKNFKYDLAISSANGQNIDKLLDTIVSKL